MRLRPTALIRAVRLLSIVPRRVETAPAPGGRRLFGPRAPWGQRTRLRSAYLSVKRYMPWLWTWYNYTDRYIPNTNNGVEGVFSDIKSKTRVHSGMRKEQRKKLIDEYISRHY